MSDPRQPATPNPEAPRTLEIRVRKATTTSVSLDRMQIEHLLLMALEQRSPEIQARTYATVKFYADQDGEVTGADIETIGPE